MDIVVAVVEVGERSPGVSCREALPSPWGAARDEPAASTGAANRFLTNAMAVFEELLHVEKERPCEPLAARPVGFPRCGRLPS